MLGKLIVSTFLLAGFVGTANASTQVYSADAVWKVKEQQAFNAFMACSTASACVSKQMKQMGASNTAVKFSTAIKNEGYLAKFQEQGKVDLGTVIYPTRANTNSAYVLLNGQPSIVSTEINKVAGLEQDAGFKQLKKKYKNLEFWGTNAQFVKNTKTKAGSNYLFKYSLKDGCNACAVPASAQVEFRFDGQGKFLGTQFVKIVK
jgi:ribosomal protein S8